MAMAPPAERDGGWSRAATRLLLLALTMELVLGGPGFWQIAGISIRRTLVATVTLWLIASYALDRFRLQSGHLWLLIWTALFMVVWTLLIPVIVAPHRIGDAVQEGFPVAVVFLAVLLHAYCLDNPSAWPLIKRAAVGSLLMAAVLAIALWVAGTYAIDPLVIGAGAAAFFTWGNSDLQPSLYIQRMPDGFFRVMWITSVLFVPGLIYCIRARRVFGALLFSMALFVSYTRGLWLTALIGIVIARLLAPREGRPAVRLRAAPVAFVGLVLVAAAVLDLQGHSEVSALHSVAERITGALSDQSADERLGQAGPLVDAWQSSPLLGAGWGSSAPASNRSDVAPYLYELTYLAMLMKLGVVGVVLVLCLFLVLLLRRSGRHRPAHVDACIVAFLAACASNPYLLNLVGLGLLCFLFIERDLIPFEASFDHTRPTTYPSMRAHL